MKRINENNFKNILKKSLYESLLTEVQTKIDNFDKWANRIDAFNQQKGGSDNDRVWFIQVMVRQKDNKNIIMRNNPKFPNYHAGANYGTFGDNTAFLVSDGAQLQAIKSTIMKYCDANNARCVIFANPRSQKAVQQYLPTFKKSLCNKHGKPLPVTDPRYINALEILYGQVKYDRRNFPDRKVAKFDVDEDNPRLKKLVIRIIKSYDPNAEFEETASGGLHVMITDQYASYVKDMIEDLKVFDVEVGRNGKKIWFPDKGCQQTVHFNPDANFILYSNVNTPGY